MKIPMYFDFIQTGEKKKFNGIPLEVSKKYLPQEDDYNCIQVLELESKDDILFIKEDYQGPFYYPFFWGYNPEYFENIIIPGFVLKKINKLQAKILITNVYEGFSFEKMVEYISKYFISKYDLSFENFVFLTGNKSKPDNIKTIYYNFWEKIVFQNNNAKDVYNDYYNLIFSDNIRKYKFICLQRRPRPYRLAVYTELYPYKDDSLLTMGTGDAGPNVKDNFYQDVMWFYKLYKKSYQKFKANNLVKTLPAKYDVDLSINNPTFDYDIEKFRESYLHVVPETYFENQNSQIFFSEKIFKPVIHFQPFIMFNQTGALQEFRSMGFETFPEVIDESYDQMYDDNDRLYATINSILEFTKQDKTTLSKVMKKVFPIFVHNYFNLISRVNHNDENIKAQLIINLYN